MSQFDGLMDDDDYSDGDYDGDAPSPGSKFAGLMSDSDDGVEEPVQVQPTVAAPPPPPPPSTKKTAKKKEQSKDDDDELAFFQKLAEQNKKNPEPVMSAPKKLELNIAKELNERFFDTSFDDSFKLPKNSSNNKFITKRKNWPNLIPPSFTIKELT